MKAGTAQAFEKPITHPQTAVSGAGPAAELRSETQRAFKDEQQQGSGATTAQVTPESVQKKIEGLYDEKAAPRIRAAVAAARDNQEALNALNALADGLLAAQKTAEDEGRSGRAILSHPKVVEAQKGLSNKIRDLTPDFGKTRSPEEAKRGPSSTVEEARDNQRVATAEAGVAQAEARQEQAKLRGEQAENAKKAEEDLGAGLRRAQMRAREATANTQETIAEARGGDIVATVKLETGRGVGLGIKTLFRWGLKKLLR